MSARTIIAAPVIWFGSWLLSVMACSGCAVPARLRQFQFWEIKKGPRGPMHTARIWMASATPRGAPGADYDKEFGNNITHLMLRLAKGCAVIPPDPRKSREGRRQRDFGSLAGF